MKNIFLGTLFGIICLILGKDKLNRGRGGQMTQDGGLLMLLGIGAIAYALILSLDLATTWLDGLLTNLTNFVNSLLPVILSRPQALLLIIGAICIIIGLIGAAIPYIKAQLDS